MMMEQRTISVFHGWCMLAVVVVWTLITDKSAVVSSFSVLPTSSHHHQRVSVAKESSNWFILAASAEGGPAANDKEGNSVGSEESTTVASDSQGADVSGEGQEVPAAEQQQHEQQQMQEEEEDPELVALKEEISKLETELKEKRQKLDLTSEQAEEYTKTGYARKVAEMENMRRSRSRMQSSDRSSATASVVTEFLPVYDELNALRAQYGEDEFGKQYNGLPEAMKKAFAELGVAEFTATVGVPMDPRRMRSLEQQVAEDVAEANLVLQPLDSGLELDGNVIRKATCVTSAAPPSSEEEATEEEQPPPSAEQVDAAETPGEEPPATTP